MDVTALEVYELFEFLKYGHIFYKGDILKLNAMV